MFLSVPLWLQIKLKSYKRDLPLDLSLCFISYLQSELQQPLAASGRPSEIPRQEQQRQRCESNAISTTWNCASALSPSSLPFLLLCLTFLLLSCTQFLFGSYSPPFLINTSLGSISVFLLCCLCTAVGVQTGLILIIQSWVLQSWVRVVYP